jgi:hypothetical protein
MVALLKQAECEDERRLNNSKVNQSQKLVKLNDKVSLTQIRLYGWLRFLRVPLEGSSTKGQGKIGKLGKAV